MDTELFDYCLFLETYNHEIIKQTPDDKSRFTKDRSFYYDIKDLPIKEASLVGKGHKFTVNLVDGHIEVDGNVIYPPKMPPENCKFQLIYYSKIKRNTDLLSEIQYDNKRNLFAKMIRKDEKRKPKRRYFIGWQAHLNGKNYKYELGVD